jgi:hypothetical protein
MVSEVGWSYQCKTTNQRYKYRISNFSIVSFAPDFLSLLSPLFSLLSLAFLFSSRLCLSSTSEMSAAEIATTGQLRPGGSKTIPHPLDLLTIAESDAARQAILDARGSNVAVIFRAIFLEEPLKEELIQFLDLEHAGKVTAKTRRPARLAKVQYDVISGGTDREYMESWVDVVSGNEVDTRVVEKMHQAGLTTYVCLKFAYITAWAFCRKFTLAPVY